MVYAINLDCGSGIGRVTSTFLINHFEKIDLVEQTEKFLDAAKNITFKDTPDRIGRYINLGLQNFTPEANKYDLIWCQWVLGHLPDQDLISLLKRFHGGLKSNGLIGVKENISRDVIQFDTEDSSVTRNEKHLKEIFEKAGLVIIKEAWQSDWPLGLYPVKMFLLRPN